MALSAFFYQPRVHLDSPYYGRSELGGDATPFQQGRGTRIACLGLRRTSCRRQNRHCVSARQAGSSHERVNNPPPVSWISNRRCCIKAPRALPSPGVEADEEEGSPWEGAIIFRRSAVQSQFDYSTTLERLGLSRYSSEKSMALAADMGFEKSEADEVVGTPVQIYVDVAKEGRDFRIDGVIQTSLGMICNRCLAPVAERVYASFSVLLTEAPVREPTQPNLGVILGKDVNNIWEAETDDDEQAELDLDLDDKLHFPRDRKEFDLSKYLRDTIHLEIPSKSLCQSSCPGLCLGCGVNLNNTACRCGKRKKQPLNGVDMEELLGLKRKTDVWGPLEQLKKQLEEQQNRAADDSQA